MSWLWETRPSSHQCAACCKAGSRSASKIPSPAEPCSRSGAGATLGLSMRLLFAARMPSISEFQVLEVLGNNGLTCIFQIIVMYLQVLECERNQHLVQTSWWVEFFVFWDQQGHADVHLSTWAGLVGPWLCCGLELSECPVFLPGKFQPASQNIRHWPQR